MASDFEIGRVVAVDTAQVTIELNADLRGLTRTTYEGAQEIGRINSYVVIPVGARRLVGMVTRVVLVEEAEVSADRTMVTLPSARRLMKATLVGTIDGDDFTQGISLFPILDNPVHLVTSADLDTIFDRPAQKRPDPPDPERPGFCVPLGQSAVFEGFPIQVDPDALFGKHAAVLGSTGSGKSCTIAGLLQAILERPEIRHTNIVILDTNGEYRSAFQKRLPGDGGWQDVATARCLFIPSSADAPASRLVIPYWLLNSDDFVRLFQAAPNIQRPVLIDAIQRAREGTRDAPAWRGLRMDIIAELNRIDAHARGTEKGDAKTIRKLADALHDHVGEPNQAAAMGGLIAVYPAMTLERIAGAAKLISDTAREGVKDEGGQYESYAPIDVRKRTRIRETVDSILQALCSLPQGGAPTETAITADTPAWFDRSEFRHSHLAQAMDREESGRARDHCATMLVRIHRLLEDPRFEFLFGPRLGQWPPATHALASFLRDILGLPSAAHPTPSLSGTGDVEEGTLPFYDRQRAGTTGHNVVVVDLHLLASEVLENVTALLGRLILEFLQRLGEVGGEATRGSLPVILVLEEAQNYIREQRSLEEKSISKEVFERIAREGRKYGLGLVIASQRPSELSKTVLSQCSTFIVHRLQNPEDLRYFKEIVPGVFGPLLDQLPALAPQTALVLGEGVRAPALVRIREARPIPRSRDPKFYRHWVDPEPPTAPVEDICAEWEGRSEEDKLAEDPADDEAPPPDPNTENPGPDQPDDDSLPF